jgi:ribonucleotide reductase alpha subunit
MDVFADNPLGLEIFKFKYAASATETWAERAKCVADAVIMPVINTNDMGILRDAHNHVAQMIATHQFLPGGRYLYYAGRSYKAYNNCYLLRAIEDTREDWADLSWKAERCLSTGGGIGVDYSVYRARGARLNRTGGVASGPISKMRMINEIGREVMQGGSRRSAIYASLNWQHPDAGDFLKAKNWRDMRVPGTERTVADLKEADFNWPAPLDMTNISLNYDDAWLANRMHPTFVENVRQALKTGEPGFSFNFGAKQNETLRNAPVSADTSVLTDIGYTRIADIIDQPVTVWTGKQWAQTVFKQTYPSAPIVSIHMSNGRQIKADYGHPFLVKVDGQPTIRLQAWRLAKGDELEVSFPHGDNNPCYVTDVVFEQFEEPVYCCDVRVPEHTFCADGVIISNCTEVSSEDDSDVCNLGSINLGRIDTLPQFADAVRAATIFLLCGTMVADLPYAKVDEIRRKNRRLGLGLMGVHEWLIQRGYRYEMNNELRQWLQVYRDVSRQTADEVADALGISRPVACRAIAPTGTIGILAGTTTGIEPLYAVAYKRRYLKNGKDWMYQLVVDSTAKRVIEKYGVDPESIESAIDLARDPARRIAFQADIQDYVDMSISSTINLPAWGSPENNPDTVQSFAETLATYAPRLRGFTAYPDGARGGQPLVRVPYGEALQSYGQEFQETVVESHDICVIGGKGGVCGV